MSELQELIKDLESKGYIYYINQCCIHYGKGNYDNLMDIDYKNEIGGELDLEKAFKKIGVAIRGE